MTAILEGLKEQLRRDRGTHFSHKGLGELGEDTQYWGQHSPESLVHEEVENQPAYWDDISGTKLDAELVREARAEELAEFDKIGAWEVVPISQCWERTGKPPIGTRWVDVNKGDSEQPVYRSRLVAQEIRGRSSSLDMFAAMPPLEAKKLLFSLATSSQHVSGDAYKIGLVDVKKAYLNADCVREVYVRLPEESHQEGMCARLKKSLYGTRDAAQNWEAEYTKTLASLGFRVGQACPCAFWHEGRDIRVVVHGDDFTILSNEDGIRWVHKQMAGKYTVKLRGVVGPNPGDEKEVTLLNRAISWKSWGIQYEADARHSEIIVRELGLSNSKGVATAGVRNKYDEAAEESLLTAEEATKYRALVARANYLAQDRPDVQFSVKELARGMAKPTEGDWGRLKRLGRYLKEKPSSRALMNYPEIKTTNLNNVGIVRKQQIREVRKSRTNNKTI